MVWSADIRVARRTRRPLRGSRDHAPRDVLMNYSGKLTLKSVQSGYKFEARINNLTFNMDSGPEVPDPNPMELLLAAAGGCTAMDVIGLLRKKRQQVTGYEVLLESERSTEHPKRYTRIVMVHRVHGRGVSPEALADAIQLSETKYCSVLAAIQPRVEIVSRQEIVEAVA